MSKKPVRPTDKQLKDKRFLASEQKVRQAFAMVKDTLDVGRLVKLAGISRATLYRHHGNIHNIVPDYENYIFHKYSLTIRRFSKIKHIRLRNLYERTFIFIFSYRRIIGFLLKYGNQDFIERLLVNLEPKLLSSTKVTNHEMFVIYSKEVAAVINEWGKAGFDKDEIPVALGKVMYLTDTAHHHLSPVVGK